MFGHRDGKVEQRLKAALRNLEELSGEIETFAKSRKREDLIQVKNTVSVLKLNIENLIALSERIHDVVEREL